MPEVVYIHYRYHVTDDVLHGGKHGRDALFVLRSASLCAKHGTLHSAIPPAPYMQWLTPSSCEGSDVSRTQYPHYKEGSTRRWYNDYSGTPAKLGALPL